MGFQLRGATRSAILMWVLAAPVGSVARAQTTDEVRIDQLKRRVKELEEQGAQPRATPSPSEAAGGTSSVLPSCQIDLVGRGLVKRHDGRGAPPGRFLSSVDFSRACWVFAGPKLSKKNPYGVFNDRKRSAG